ncbi:MAG: site-specific integrase [bacterium]|nr:site-specific integrase [bacterium]
MPRQKRPPGEGTVTIRKDGRYEAARTIGYNERGNPIRIRAYGITQGEARDKLERKIQDMGGHAVLGTLADASQVTVADWLESWVRYKETVDELKPSTTRNYRHLATKHINPRIGTRRIQTIRPAHVEDILSQMARDGLSKRTRRYVWQALNNAFKHAVRRQLLPSNPCDAVVVSMKGGDARTPETWTPEEANLFLQVAKKHSRLYPLYRLVLTTGLRRGEVLALQLTRDLALIDGRISVLQTQSQTNEVTTVKTERSRRTIPLPADTIEALEQHLDQRADLATSESMWEDSGRLFTTKTGTTISARHLYDDYKAVIRRCNQDDKGKAIEPQPIKDLTFHDLRHTYATLALRAEVPVHVVAKRLGHRDASITMKIYAHVLADMEQAGALTMDELTAPKPAATSDHKSSVN